MADSFEPEPLLQQLPMELQHQLESGPASIREKVMAHEKVMISQIKQFTKGRRTELLNMAEYELGRYKSEQRRQELLQKKAESKKDQPLPKPALKSIVKQRPLRSKKRVSFSDSPPRVETFLDDDDFSSSDDDEPLQDTHNKVDPEVEDNLESSAQDQTSDPEASLARAMDDASTGDEASDYDANVVQEYKEPPSPQRPGQFSLEEPEFQPTKHSVPSEWRTEMIEYTAERPPPPTTSITGPFKYDLQAIESPQESRPADTGPSFSFDDIMDQDDTPLSSGGSVESDAEEEPTPLNGKNSNDGTETSSSVSSRRYSHDHLIVGSAPINIHLPGKGVDGDGGPIPTSGLEREEEEDISGTLPSITELRNEIDSGNMSFSQRMVWEERHKP